MIVLQNQVQEISAEGREGERSESERFFQEGQYLRILTPRGAGGALGSGCLRLSPWRPGIEPAVGRPGRGRGDVYFPSLSAGLCCFLK